VVSAEDSVEVGGSINTGEGVKARSVEIGSRGTIHGPVRAEEITIGKEAHVENLYGKEILLRSGATAENVYGEYITIESHCRVNGETQYTNELRQERDVSFGKPPEKVNAVPT
jgi:cytoskeletal protein CcmA (bactofilin family)